MRTVELVCAGTVSVGLLFATGLITAHAGAVASEACLEETHRQMIPFTRLEKYALLGTFVARASIQQTDRAGPLDIARRVAPNQRSLSTY